MFVVSDPVWAISQDRAPFTNDTSRAPRLVAQNTGERSHHRRGNTDTDAQKRQQTEKKKPPAKHPGFEAYDQGNFGLACELLLPLAVKGNPDAQYKMATLYQNGKGCELNKEASFYWMKKAAEGGVRHAQVLVAMMYRDGNGVSWRIDEAVGWFRHAADDGDPEAQFELGKMYESGYGVDKDPDAAMRWYRRAAEQKYVPAEEALAHLRRQRREARRAAREAAEREAAEREAAARQPSAIIVDGRYEPSLPAGVTPSLSEGKKAYERGDHALAMAHWLPFAHSGDADAQFAVGVFYVAGQGIPTDLNAAGYWLGAAAAQGHEKARKTYAQLQEYNRLLHGAEDAGEQTANIARVPAGSETMDALHRRAETNNDPLAQVELGSRYASGNGIARDDARAADWYRRAADQGNADAQYDLGTMYAAGRGVLQDFRIAHMWFNLAAARGHGASRRERDAIAKNMTATDIAAAQAMARQWLEKHR